jgi:predicted transposase/invertase (TIGR01784 family)
MNTIQKKYPILLPVYDFVFKLIFGDERNADVLIDLLKAMLDIPHDDYDSVTIVDPHLNAEYEGDKIGILDVRLKTKSGKIINIEMQMKSHPFMRERIVLYLAKMLARQLKKKESYSRLKKVISIVITNFNLMRGKGDKTICHNRFTLNSELTKSRFSDIVEVHTLELPKTRFLQDNEKLEQWVQFFNAKDEEDFMKVAKKNPAIKKAVTVVKKMSRSEMEEMIADAEEMARLDRLSLIEWTKERAMKRAMKQVDALYQRKLADRDARIAETERCIAELIARIAELERRKA